jgi:hypothetical protein
MTNATSYDLTPSLRERFVEDMNLHRLSRATQRNYLRDVARFASWLGRRPIRLRMRICDATRSSSARRASARR